MNKDPGIEIVLATKNAHKVLELQSILSPLLPVTIIAFGGEAPVENGTSFAENALIKAQHAAEETGKIAIADDSGISVDILGGAPGIFSARWSGPDKNDHNNNELLLWQLHDVKPEHRGAAFVCAAAVVLPQHIQPRDGGPQERTVVARWNGRVATEASGAHGFGYDPIFQPEGYEFTSAHLRPEEKNHISHRFRAFTELATLLTTNIL